MAKACPGKSVGGVYEEDGKVLMLYRRYEPYGWACPAGHIEEGDSPEQTLLKEYDEETGLKVRGFQFAFDEFVPWNNCHRSNNEGHHWWIYKVLRARSEIKISEEETQVDPKTGTRWGWFAPQEIAELDVEPVWLHFLKKLGYIKTLQ